MSVLVLVITFNNHKSIRISIRRGINTYTNIDVSINTGIRISINISINTNMNMMICIRRVVCIRMLLIA